MNFVAAIPPWLAALPWFVVPLVILIRFRRSRSVRDYAPARGADVPRVSVIVPARDEARKIERCIRSILLTTYPNMELIVVDDHSSDGTGNIARAIIASDPRARVTQPPALPGGWFGKQWACAHGASLATGDLLLFTDADTFHGPTLLGRTVTALRERKADLLSVICRQEVVSFWEQAGQPAIFLALMAIVGNTESMSASTNRHRKGANGQYMLFDRRVYDALDGHAAVRAHVAEDIYFAWLWTAAGRRVHALLALDDMSTRMYDSLGEFIAGWRKNVWVGGKHAFGEHRVWRATARVLLPFLPLVGIVPLIAFSLAAVGLAASWWLWFGLAGHTMLTLALLGLFPAMGFPAHTALLYPLGCLLCVQVFAAAAIRGDRTSWKGRDYRVP